MVQIFQTSLSDAMNYKGSHPNSSLIVSMEDNRSNFDSLWRDPNVLSIIQNSIFVLRLSLKENENDFNQFKMIFNVMNIPSVYYFAPNSASISKIWEQFPRKEEFVNFFSPNDFSDKHSEEEKQELTAKILIQGPQFTRTRIFKGDDTIGDLKKWAFSQFGENTNLIISSTRLPLQNDEEQTLLDAGLTPTAILTIPTEVNENMVTEDEQLVGPYSPEERETQQENRRHFLPDLHCNFHFLSYIKLFFSIFNPFSTSSDDDINVWEFQPNPQIADDIIQRLQFGIPNY